ncbi:CrcB family protein [Nocardioides dubius]|uniref:Fluoride-specific ion channel FluC n=1 Tax=Nocardioides dubius TaxID=317019 RepID=A0ABN1TVH8_9ACTN
MSVLWVCLGAALGAGVRQLANLALAPRPGRRHDVPPIPRATLLVNLVGSLILGVLVGADPASARLTLALGIGFCGALTTWSSLSYEVLDVARRRGLAVATGLLTASLLTGVLAAAIGFGIGQAL